MWEACGKIEKIRDFSFIDRYKIEVVLEEEVTSHILICHILCLNLSQSLASMIEQSLSSCKFHSVISNRLQPFFHVACNPSISSDLMLSNFCS
jgi:hypothetical protein